MFARHGHTNTAVKVHVTVTDVIGIQRVLTMLTGRQQTFTRFEAEEAGAGRWSLRLDLTAGPGQVDLAAARLHRLPSVLAVDIDRGTAPGAGG